MRSSSDTDPGLGLVELLAHELALVARGLGQHLAGGRDVLAGRRQVVPRLDDLGELLVAARQVAQLVGVGQRDRVGQLRLDGVELGFERGHPVVDHDWKARLGLAIGADRRTGRARRAIPIPVEARRASPWPAPCARRSGAGSARPVHRSRPASACP